MSRALTMDEAADELRISRRAFQEVVQRHPHYYVNGRRNLRPHPCEGETHMPNINGLQSGLTSFHGFSSKCSFWSATC